MRRVLIFLLFLTTIVFISSSFAQPTEITNGLNYLFTTQNPDGSWGNDTSSVDVLPATVSIMEALQILDETGTVNYSNATAWLQGQSIETTDYLSERIHALSVGGADLNLLISYLDEIYTVAWGGYEDYEANNLDTALALQALKAVDYPDLDTIGYALGYLISTQNPDGGFGFYPSTCSGCSEGDGSNVYMTAVVLNTLQQFSQTTSLATAINKATNWLVGRQTVDGGWGSVYETALAYIALVGVTTDNTVLGNAINYLLSTQLSNGSWDNDPYSTALALRALYFSENKPTPPPPAPTTGAVTGTVVDAATNQPLEGVTVVSGQLSATTTNTGAFTLSNIPAGSQTITFSLNGYTTATVTVNITAGSIINLGTIPLSASPTTGIIKGTVTDAANSQPLSDVTITVTGSFSGSTVTGADGTFIFTNVTPGSVTITASKTGYYSVTGTGTVVAGGILFFNPQLSTTPPTQTTGDLTGKVYDASTDKPILGATVSISGGPSTSTDSQGVFLIQDITPNTYQVTISAAGYISQVYQVMILTGVTTDMQTVYLTPSPSSSKITGKVIDAQTGSPITSADVVVVGTGLSTKTDSTGTYTITGITLLEFNLKASATGYDSLTYNVKTTAYGSYTIDFALNPSQVSDLRIVSLATDKQSYMADEDLLITSVIENSGSLEIQGLVMAEIEDGDGNVIALVSPAEPLITLAPSGSIQTEMKWNTGQFAPGEYFIVSKVTDPETVGTQNPTGDVLTERAVSISITPVPALGGSIALNPPVTQADMQTPVVITAAIRNTGNIPITTTLRLDVTFNGNVVYTRDSAVTDLQVNNIQEIDFGSFIPQEGGDYAITLRPVDTSITLDISTTLYVGPHATATFKVEPTEALPGDVDVRGRIHITGAGAASGTTQDPLVPLIKEAIQRGVNYEQPAVMTWHNTKRCYGCHIQTQALYGLETSRTRATIDENVTRTLFDALKGWQKPDGSVYSGINYAFTTQTQLALWAYTSWHDEDEAKPYILKSVDYLLNRQATNGSWTCDHCSGWWGSRVSATAITMIGISKAYALSNDPVYLTSLEKGVHYLLTPNLVSGTDNMLMAHQVIGLEAALSVITDQTLRYQITNTINETISLLNLYREQMEGGEGLPVIKAILWLQRR